MKKFILTAAALGLMSVNLVAKAEVAGSCGTIHIQVSNETGTSCKLSHFDIVHGIYEVFPPTQILAGDSKFVDIDQWGYGPNIELTYDCGGKKVILKSQMNRSIFWGKTPSASILEQDRSLSVTHNEVSGSCFFLLPGVVNWVISKND